MPAFFTHYRFGVSCFKTLSEGIVKSAIKTHPHAYSLGSQGPDLFFYSIEEICSKGENYGVRLHKENTGAFLMAMIQDTYETKEADTKEIKLAYTLGFLTHYFLDCNVHGYVYSRAGIEKNKETTGKHYELESDIDLRVLEKLENKTPNDYSQPQIISLSRKERLVIGELLSHTVPAVLQDIALTQKQAVRVLKDMHFVLGLFQDRTGQKGRVAAFFEKKLFGYVYGSPLLCNNRHGATEDACNEGHCKWKNPYGNDVSTQSVFDLMEQAKDEVVRLAVILEKLFDKRLRIGENEEEALFEAVSEMIGNRSYKSGYELV